ncbi:tRNA (adenosine(37)-N6)-threonylcarbamoyltransferase complex transferase subunit TsaD [Patescibacteria group bacterium]|nr:tRNA (adenosine(37)-N6)-threonylcarbamoyltransferase complex transferase subunit TsaD [Patescibacteria group bacterium]
MLSIETSCDETAIAILKCSGELNSPWPGRPAGGPNFEILANEVSSQIKIHRPFGGVVPNLAKREHIKNLPILLKKVFKNLQSPIDYIAVTVGPGLEPALWTGINFAQDLAKKLKKPLIGVNHMEGHLFAFLLKSENLQFSKPNLQKSQRSKISFPAIGLVVSGGHTIIIKMQSLTKWKKLGETVDDAAGEAFDKVAKMLELPYPGGPEIEKLAKQGSPKAIDFPRPMLNQKNYNFSFSGLKTSVLYYLKKHKSNKKAFKSDVAASFQRSVVDVLTKKAIRSAMEFKAKSIVLCGGVACNKTLRETIKKNAEENDLKFIAPEFKFNTDNAAMIGVAAYINLLSKKRTYKIEADSNLNL